MTSTFFRITPDVELEKGEVTGNVGAEMGRAWGMIGMGRGEPCPYETSVIIIIRISYLIIPLTP